MKLLSRFPCVPIGTALLVVCGCARHSGSPGYSESGPSPVAFLDAAPQPAAVGTSTASTPVATPIYSSDIFSTEPADNRLVSEMRAALQREDALSEVAPRVSVGASDGTVVLLGTVRTQLEKERIHDIARDLPGSRAVDNRLQVANIASATPSDTLSATARGDAGTIGGVNTRAGVSGSAAQSASETATLGVDSTTEQLTPTSRPGGAGPAYGASDASVGHTGQVNVEVQGSNETDRTLAQRISESLRADTSLAAALAQAKVIVAEGRILLRGTVRNEVQKREVEAAIQRVTGAGAIENQLRVDASLNDPLLHNP